MAVRLIQLEEPKATKEDVLCSREAFGGKKGSEDAAARGLSCLQALGQGTIHDALAIAGSLAERDTESIHHRFHGQTEQLARRCRSTEHAHGRRAMPTAIQC